MPTEVWRDLTVVEPLKQGRSSAREPTAVQPVAWCDVEVVTPMASAPFAMQTAGAARQHLLTTKE